MHNLLQICSLSTMVPIGRAECGPISPPFPSEKEDILKALGIRVTLRLVSHQIPARRPYNLGPYVVKKERTLKAKTMSWVETDFSYDTKMMSGVNGGMRARVEAVWIPFEGRNGSR